MLPVVAEEESPREQRRRLETAIAILAALSTLAFAWAGFQSSQWVRERFLLSDEAAAASEQAVQLDAEADRLLERDTILVIEWLVALERGDVETADVMFEIFRPTLQAWVRRIDPEGSGRSVDAILDADGYDVNGLRRDSEELEAESRELTEAARDASRTAARYSGLSLLFAVVIALVGFASRFDDRRTKRGLVVFAGVMLAAGLVLLALSPVKLWA